MNRKLSPYNEPAKIAVNPDGSTYTVHLNKDVPDVAVMQSEDGKKLVIRGLYRPVKIQFSGDNVFWCTLADAGPEIKIEAFGEYASYANLIKEISEIETGYSIRERIAEYAIVVKESWGYVLEENGYILDFRELDYDNNDRCFLKTTEKPLSTYNTYVKRTKEYEEHCLRPDPVTDDCDEWEVDEDGEFVLRFQGRYLYYYETEVVLKRRGGEYVSVEDPFNDGTAYYTGELWVVSLYGAEFVTKLYTYDGKRKWWFNPFADDKHIIVYESVGGEQYGGRRYDEQSDPQYTEANDPALNPSIISELSPGIAKKVILAGSGESIGIHGTHYGEMETYQITPQTMFPSYGGLAVYQYGDGWNLVSNMDLNLPYKDVPGESQKKANPIPWAFGKIGKFVVTNYPEEESKAFVFPTMESSYSLLYRSSESRYTVFDEKLMLITIAAANEEKKSITLEFPDDLASGKASKIVSEMKKLRFTKKFDVVSSPGVLSDEEKLDLYKAQHKIGTIKPFYGASDEDIMAIGGFWVTEKYVYIPQTISAGMYPTPETDKRFEKVYDPHSLDLMFDDPIDISSVDAIVSDMKAGKILRVITRNLFRKTKDGQGRTVYASIPWDAAGFLNALAEKMEDESILVSIIYPDDFEEVGANIESDYPRYPSYQEYDKNGVSSQSDTIAEAMQLVARADERYLDATSTIDSTAVKHIASIGLAVGLHSSSDNWSVEISDSNSEYAPSGSSMTVAKNGDDYSTTIYGDWSAAVDPFENKFFVEYSPTVGADGEIIVGYVAYDIDGNDVTDQVVSASFDDYLMIKE